MSQRPQSVGSSPQFLNDNTPSRSLLARPVSLAELNRVLIVEFRDEIFASLAGRLQTLGSVIERAEAGKDAVKQLKSFNPQLILINQEMPEESGCVISHQLRLKGHRHAIWLYCVNLTDLLRQCSLLCRIDHVVEYKGDVALLDANLVQVIEEHAVARATSE